MTKPDDFEDLLDIGTSENSHDTLPWHDDEPFVGGCYEVLMLLIGAVLGVCCIVAAVWGMP